MEWSIYNPSTILDRLNNEDRVINKSPLPKPQSRSPLLFLELTRSNLAMLINSALGFLNSKRVRGMVVLKFKAGNGDHCDR